MYMYTRSDCKHFNCPIENDAVVFVLLWHGITYS